MWYGPQRSSICLTGGLVGNAISCRIPDPSNQNLHLDRFPGHAHVQDSVDEVVSSLSDGAGRPGVGMAMAF